MKHLLLIGPPGAGKGTLAKELNNYTQVSTGDILRAEKASGSELGQYIQSLIDNGKFVDDETMLKLLKKNLPEKTQLIFDGYPRNLTQIPYFEKLIKEVDSDYHLDIIFFDMDLNKLEDRIINRVSCSNKDCGEIYNLKNKAPKKEDTCDKCGNELDKRNDDNAEAFKERLEVYKSNTAPVAEHYKSHKNFHKINADQIPQKVLEEVKNKI